MSKTAVILFNLGGPDSLKAVRPFLFNLFSDAAIITLPQPFRFMLALLISTLRTKKAQGIYQHMGGKSPILEQTVAQAEALEKSLKEKSPGEEFKVFVCMRHWHPMSEVVVKKVKAYAPDHVLLLPLYPQFSTTTTGSSFSNWEEVAQKNKLDVTTTRICCYPNDLGFVASYVKLIKEIYWKAAETSKPRILFSAHGLPEKIITDGDPYQWQVEKSVATIVQVLAIDDLDYSICYQSRVGRLKWIGPSTEEEITQAGNDKVSVLVVPISFVSEHSETLVELDIDYRNLAQEKGVVSYWRVPALATEPFYIDMLSDLCVNNKKDGSTRAFNQERLCPNSFEQCLCRSNP
jgi:protoporphyrin/coproporphyrin ferrochelatase